MHRRSYYLISWALVILCKSVFQLLVRIASISLFIPQQKMKIGRRKHSESFMPSIIMRKWFNIKPKVHEFSEDDDDTGSENHGTKKTIPNPFLIEVGEQAESTYEASENASTSRNYWTSKAGTHGKERSRRFHRRKSETLRVQYIRKKDVRVLIGTWNVAGKAPVDDLKLDEWLCTGEPAEMYIIGFQEVVPLNAGNVLGAEDRRPVAKWEAVIRKALNGSQQPRTLYKSYSAPTSILCQMLTSDDAFLSSKCISQPGFDTNSNNCSSNNIEDEAKVFKLEKVSEMSSAIPVNDEHKLDWPEYALDSPSQAFESAIEKRFVSGTSRIGFDQFDPHTCASQQSNIKVGLKRVYHSYGNLGMFWSEQEEASDALCSVNYISDEDSLTEKPIDEKETKYSNETSNEREKYVRIASKQMVGIYISVWINRKMRRHINNLKVLPVGVGLMGYMGNKGSVSVSVSLFQTCLCFVCSHLTSGHKVRDHQKRNSDVCDILERTKFSTTLDSAQPQTIPSHDRIFWFGDLNYRLNLTDAKVRELVAIKDWDELMKYDQLSTELKSGRTFDGWKEGLISFPPTYKYEINSNRYVGEIGNGEKKRSPAWCDRILWLGKGIKQLGYWRSEIALSDHRPVSSMFSVEVEVFDGRRLKRVLNLKSAGLLIGDL